jgi:hypothetical protein
MVVAFLTIVAAAGATSVYFVGESQHRRDRTDILRWEARALPAAADAISIEDGLHADMSVAEVVSARTALQRDLTTITRRPLPEIVRPAVAAYIEAFRRAEAALAAVGTTSFLAAKGRATAAFDTAAAAVQTLVCRARLPACVTP